MTDPFETSAVETNAVHCELIRILLVDDHAIVREGVRALCDGESDLAVIGEASDGREALAILANNRVDLAMIDLRMPGMPAAQLVAEIRQSAPHCNVLIFTSFGEDQTLVEVIQAGAIGYLLKDAKRSDLLAAVRAVAAGQPWLHHSLHAQVVALLRRKPNADPYEALSRRERSVLGLLGQGFSNRQIAQALSLTEGTVKGYVSNVLRKLSLTQRTQAALFVAKHPL